MAPFKLKFSKMSKSESSARGDSLDLPGDGDTDHGSVSTPETVCVQDSLPPSPPPTYEDVLEEVTFTHAMGVVQFLPFSRMPEVVNLTEDT